MKYLFIFLPFFAFGQDTIAFPDGDTLIHGKLTYGGNSALYEVIEPTTDTCWEIKNGWMSLKPRCVNVPYFNASGYVVYTNPFYVNSPLKDQFRLAPPKPKVVESFKHAGAYYELRENGWYKEIFPDTIPWHRPGEGFPDTCWRVMGNIRVLKPGCFEIQRIESWRTEWIPCDQHIGKAESYQREKVDTSEVKLLVWTGCSVAEISATRYLFYNEMQVAKNTGGLAVYITETIKVNVIARYVSKDKWIKPSHVIKEL